MSLRFITLRDMPTLTDAAAAWFHAKWRVPKEAYLECMHAYLSGQTEYGWYLCLDGDQIVGGLGVIENDFHDRKDLIRGYLDDVTGVYQTPRGYYVDDADVEAFDKAFPPKEKLRLPGQIF